MAGRMKEPDVAEHTHHTTGLLLASLSLPCAAINLRANLFPTRKVRQPADGRASNPEGKLAAARVREIFQNCAAAAAAAAKWMEG